MEDLLSILFTSQIMQLCSERVTRTQEKFLRGREHLIYSPDDLKNVFEVQTGGKDLT